MRKTTRGLAVVATTVASVLALATPAFAHQHDANVYNGWTWLGQVRADNGHEHGFVCDKQDDGVGVYGRFKVTGGAIYDVADSDGYGGICPGFTAPVGKYIIEIEAVWRGTSSKPQRTSGWHKT